MIKLAASGMLLAAMMFTDTAIAGDPPAPRQPIGPNPRQLNEMLPPTLLNRLPPLPNLPNDHVRITNQGDQKLFISYWDGEAAWRAVPIDAGHSTDVVCPKCAGTINIAYHNGAQDKFVKAKGGSAYVLTWSPQSGAWVLTPLATR